MAKKSSTRKKGEAPKKRSKSGKKRGQITVSIRVVAFVIFAVSIMVALPYLKDSSPREKGAAIPQGDYLYGIDISRYQADIQWDSLMVLTDGEGRTIQSKTFAKEIKPVSFVYIKATEGLNMKDKHFKRHWEKAAEAGISRGAYHFFRSSKNGEIQANHFIKTVGELRYKDLPPVLDIETIHPGCNDKQLNERALEWLRAVEAHYGRKPIVYSSAAFIKEHLSKEITDNYPVWVAHYNSKGPAFEGWDIWQFTDQALIHGISGPVDLNVRRK